jgi:hypothetical protein
MNNSYKKILLLGFGCFLSVASYAWRLWTPEEDQLLLDLVEQYGTNEWPVIAFFMEDRSARQCRENWHKYFAPGVSHKRKNKAWTPEEDQIIRNHVAQYGPSSWAPLEKQLPGRTAKQCKEHYENCLVPGIRHDSWTLEEDQIIIDHMAENGPGGWVSLMQQLPGRTANQIRDRWRKHLAPRIAKQSRNRCRRRPAYRIAKQSRNRCRRHPVSRTAPVSRTSIFRPPSPDPNPQDDELFSLDRELQPNDFLQNDFNLGDPPIEPIRLQDEFSIDRELWR